MSESSSQWQVYERVQRKSWGKYSTEKDAEMACKGFKKLAPYGRWVVLEVKTVMGMNMVLDPECDEDKICFTESRDAI